MPTAQPRSGDPSCPRVVVVDHDRRIRQSLSDVLRLTGGLDVVGHAGDVRTALELVEREQPDVVVVDPRLPDLQAGAALVSSVALRWPSVRVVLTGWIVAAEHPELVGRAVASISKSASPEAFVAAMVRACADERPDPRLSREPGAAGALG